MKTFFVCVIVAELFIVLSSIHGAQPDGGLEAENGYCGVEKDDCNSAGVPDKEREYTFILIKPDGVQRGLVGEIIKRLEGKGFKIVAMKFVKASEELLKLHYSEHSDKEFFPGLIKYMSSGPVIPMIWQGANVISSTRALIGATNPKDATPGTIRGDYCIQVGRNVIHGSDSFESAKREITLWFQQREVTLWNRANEMWIYED